MYAKYRQVCLGYIFLVRPGTLLALFGSLWPSFGVPVALLWRSFGLPSAPWGSRVLPGSPRQMLFTIWSPLSEQIWRFEHANAQDLASRNLPGSPAKPPETVSGTAPPGPISTRAGGQDDVS